MVPTSVVNIKHKSVQQGSRYIYIGRPTIWGNPFSHLTFLKHNGLIIVPTVQAAVDAYRDWLDGKRYQHLEQERRSHILRGILELDGKILGCYCAPGPCHGNVLMKMIEARKGQANT